MPQPSLSLAPDRRPDAPEAGTAGGRSLRLVMLVLAFACGASVANLYYAQPLLALIGRDLRVGHRHGGADRHATQSATRSAWLCCCRSVTCVENRKLLTRHARRHRGRAGRRGVCSGLRASSSIAVTLVGLASVVAQMLVPLAAHLAPDETAGRVRRAGHGGLLLGIMLARSASSLAAAAWGWRSIYAISAGDDAADRARRASAWCRAASRSTRRLCAAGRLVGHLSRAPSRYCGGGHWAKALMFGAFTAYWTAIADELTRHHGLSQTGVAVFALVGASGAAAAPIAGRLGDRGHAVAGRAAATVLGTVALLLAAVGASSLLLLVVSAVLLDFAVQGHHVLSLRDIYTLRPEARARMNSVYMGRCVHRRSHRLGGHRRAADTRRLVRRRRVRRRADRLGGAAVAR